MRILLLTQWFQPEPQFKGLPLAKALIQRGHEVEVLTGFPNYPGGKLYPGYRVRPRQREVMDGIKVTRAALYPSHDRSVCRRSLNYLSFALSSAALALTMRRPDVVYVYCPPMTAAAGAYLLRLLRRVPYLIDVQDLWPDTLASTGMVRQGLMMRLVGAWSNFVMKRAAGLVVLSNGFKERLEARGLGVQIDVIYNWAPPEIADLAQSQPTLPQTAKGEGFNIVFAGNMGRAQALETVIEAARILCDEAPAVRFTMVGGGVDAEQLRMASAATGLSNITFLPPRPLGEMGPLLGAADALLVHLRNDPLFEITIPSKVQAYLAVGRPILMGVRGDAAKIVEQSGAGIVFEPENARSLADAAVALAKIPAEERAAMGRAGASYYRANMAFDQGVDALVDALTQAAR